MLEFVHGEKRNPFAANALIEQFEQSELNGTLYIGYPILASVDQTTIIDALLTTLESGVVVFDFVELDDDSKDKNEVQQHQDDLYTAVYQKFLNFKPLREGRELSVEIKIVTLSPNEDEATVEEDLYVIGYKAIPDLLKKFNSITESQLRNINSAVQRVTTIKPPQRRISVKHKDSRGGIIKRIEAEIANLDKWQKQAAVETPEGPQRIRGLAGSGKTIVLALKASYLHVLHPEWRICVTFQTRTLYQQFTDLIRRFTFDSIHDEPDWDQLKILHAWGSAGDPGVYSEIAIANNIKPQTFRYGKEKFGQNEAFGGICKELLNSIKNRDLESQFDIVLIDEAQDFPQSFFELVYLATSQPKRICWAYDELQNLGVYSMAPPSELFGSNNRGSPRVPELSNSPRLPQQDLVLPICYRNTPWALTIAHALGFGVYRDDGLVQFFDDPGLWKDVGYELMSGNMSPGKYVELRRSQESSPSYFSELIEPQDSIQCFVFTNEDEQARWIAKSIHNNLTQDELELRDILIIISNPLTAVKKAARIVKYLGEYNIPAHVAGVTTSKDILFDDESVAISGIYRAKGNEAPMVYLIDSEYCYSGYELIKRRNILFTGMTRSRAWVRISGCGPNMSKLKEEFDTVINNNYKLYFKVPTPGELEQIRKIHRDMSKKERIKAAKFEKTLEEFLAMVDQGLVSIENLPPELKDRLSRLIQDSISNDTKSN